jgi:hypothetical protein
LSIPHVVRTCSSCGREVDMRELGDHGRGIKTEAGDRFVIPAGFIQLSANPLKGSGRLFRPGLAMFARLVLIEGYEAHRDDVLPAIRKEREQYDSFLRSSDLLKEFNLDDPAQGDAAVEKLKTHDQSPEWWAICADIFSA